MAEVEDARTRTTRVVHTARVERRVRGRSPVTGATRIATRLAIAIARDGTQRANKCHVALFR